MQQLSTKKSGAVYSLISAHEFSQKSKKLLYKSINLALKNTKKSEHSKFLDVHSVNILTLLLNHFNKEESAKAFSQISALKQREKSPSYPKPKKESWVEIYSQAKECLLCLDKNIRIAYHLKIESKQYFIPISSNSNESFFSRDLI